MAKRKGGNEGLLIALACAAGAVLLYYSQRGRGEENNAKSIPDSIEGKIDLVVKKLNDHFGKQWVTWGFDALEAYLKATLPPQVVAVVGAVIMVEQISGRNLLPMTSYEKQQTAVRNLRAAAALVNR